MTQLDLDEAREWLNIVYGDVPGFIHICSTGDWDGRTFQSGDVETALTYVDYLDSEKREGIYVRACTLRNPPQPGKRGGDDQSFYLPGLWADLDIAGPGHKTSQPLPATEDEAMQIVEAAGLPAPSHWIHSGGGLYAWWLLEEATEIDDLEFFRTLSSGWQKCLEHGAKKLGLHYGAGVGDLSRVLRLPGTVNRKAGLERPCTGLHPHAWSGERFTVDQLYTFMVDATPPAPPPPAPLPLRDPDDTRPGDAFNATMQWQDVLPAGWVWVYRRGDKWHLRRPGKDRETSATISLTTDRFYPFTDAAPPFEPLKHYSKFEAYCVAPETKILTADLNWVQAGELSVGDELVGIDEEIERFGGRRKLRVSEVTGIEFRTLPCYQVTLEDGRQVVCTDEHPWLACSAGGGGNMRWIRTKNMRPGQRVCSLTDGTWEPATDFDSGWLSGMYDGEGCASGTTVMLAQKTGHVFDRAERLLKERGFEPKRRIRQNGMGNLTIGDLPSIFRLLGTLRPGRLLAKRSWVGRGAWVTASPKAVVASVVFLGERRVAAFSTSTRTFIAEGLVSHNTLLEHNGNFSAAASELARRGLGTRHESYTSGVLASSVPATIGQQADGLPVPVSPGTTSTVATRSATSITEWDSRGIPVYDREVFRYLPNWTGVELGEMWAQLHENTFRYIPADKVWMQWNGVIWERSEGSLAHHSADIMTRRLLQRAEQVNVENPDVGKHLIREAKKATTSTGVNSIITLGRVNPCIASAWKGFDKERNLVALDNGVLNLDTLQLQSHDHRLMLTKKLNASFNPDRKEGRFTRFMEEVLPDQQVREYLQRICGYALTGEADSRVLVQLYGKSGTGKSQFIKALFNVLGDFAKRSSDTAFQARNSGYKGPSEDLHSLMGSRFAMMPELDEGFRMNVSLIKQLTGGDLLTTRKLYGQEVTWRPEFTVFMISNHLPRVSAGEEAYWNRVKPIKFDQVFVDSNGEVDLEENRNLGEKMATEEPEVILNWLLEGLKQYRERGLDTPEQIQQWRDDYRDEVDTVRQFLNEAPNEGRIEIKPESMVTVRQLHLAYAAWCSDNQVNALGMRKFNDRLAANGFERHRKESGITWSGIGLQGFVGEATTPARGSRWGQWQRE